MNQEKLHELIQSLEHSLQLAKQLQDPNITIAEAKPNYTDENWPQAVKEDAIVNIEDENEKQWRANQIRDHLITIPIIHKNVLDFGCGEGHVAHEIAKTATQCVGYDVNRYDQWDTKIADNLFLLTNWEIVTNHGPFDSIILFDVIDHLLTPPSKTLRELAQLLTTGGSMYVRAHPWTSRHGAHLYTSINKAFLHLALTPGELIQLGYIIPETIKIKKPLATYEAWFREAGLNIVQKNVDTTPPEDYFSGPLLQRIINNTWNGEVNETTARKIMANDFITYILTTQ